MSSEMHFNPISKNEKMSSLDSMIQNTILNFELLPKDSIPG